MRTLEPDASHTLTVTPSSGTISAPTAVHDGFGLPLLAGSISFTTAKLDSLLWSPEALDTAGGTFGSRRTMQRQRVHC